MRTGRTAAFLMAGVVAAFSAAAEAAYKEPCKLKYETQEGWSDPFEAECMYATGSELNESTQSFRFDIFNGYVLIFWSKEEASAIRIEGFAACGAEAEPDCAYGPLRKLKGVDQDGVQWEVCQAASEC